MDDERLKRLLKTVGVSIIVIMALKYVLLKTATQVVHAHNKAAAQHPQPAAPAEAPPPVISETPDEPAPLTAMPPLTNSAPDAQAPTDVLANSASAIAPVPVAASTPFIPAEAPAPAP